MQEGGLYEIELYITNKEDDTALDLSSSDLAMEWYGANRCNSPIVLTSGNGLTLTDADEGRIVIALTPSQTCQLGPGEARAILFQDYNDADRKAWLLEGSEMVEAKRFDA